MLQIYKAQLLNRLMFVPNTSVPSHTWGFPPGIHKSIGFAGPGAGSLEPLQQLRLDVLAIQVGKADGGPLGGRRPQQSPVVPLLLVVTVRTGQLHHSCSLTTPCRTGAQNR